MEHTIKLTGEEVMALHFTIITHVCSKNDCSNCLLKNKRNELCIANKIIKQNIDELNINE